MAENDQIELELDSSEETEVSVEPSVDAESGDQFEQAENATQSRINRLTKKMREAERRENEALNYAKQVQAEANSLKQRMSSLDNSYVNEYTTRVETQLAQTEKEMARAMELGDTQAAVEAQRKLTSLSIENDRASQAKMQQERQKEAASQQPQQQAQPQQQQMRRPRARTTRQRPHLALGVSPEWPPASAHQNVAAAMRGGTTPPCFDFS